MDFIFDDHDVSVVCLVGNQLVSRLKLDVVAIAPELGHQISASFDNARPTGNVVEDLVDGVVSDDVEEVLTIDEVAERPSYQVEVWLRGLKGLIIPTRHPWALHALNEATYNWRAARSISRMDMRR